MPRAVMMCFKKSITTLPNSLDDKDRRTDTKTKKVIEELSLLKRNKVNIKLHKMNYKPNIFL